MSRWAGRAEYPLRTLAELMAQEHVPGAQLLEGLVWKGKIHWLFSRPGSGKTLWALDQGCTSPPAAEFCGRASSRGRSCSSAGTAPTRWCRNTSRRFATSTTSAGKACRSHVNEQHGLRIESGGRPAEGEGSLRVCPQAPVYVIVDSCESLVPSEVIARSKSSMRSGQFLRWMSDRGARHRGDRPRAERIERCRHEPAREAVRVHRKGQDRGTSRSTSKDRSRTATHGKVCEVSGQFSASAREIGFYSDTGFTLKDVLVGI